MPLPVVVLADLVREPQVESMQPEPVRDPQAMAQIDVGELIPFAGPLLPAGGSPVGKFDDRLNLREQRRIGWGLRQQRLAIGAAIQNLDRLSRFQGLESRLNALELPLAVLRDGQNGPPFEPFVQRRRLYESCPRLRPVANVLLNQRSLSRVNQSPSRGSGPGGSGPI